MREVEKFISVLWRVSKFLDNARIFKMLIARKVLWRKCFFLGEERWICWENFLPEKKELIKNNWPKFLGVNDISIDLFMKFEIWETKSEMFYCFLFFVVVALFRFSLPRSVFWYYNSSTPKYNIKTAISKYRYSDEAHFNESC